MRRRSLVLGSFLGLAALALAFVPTCARAERDPSAPPASPTPAAEPPAARVAERPPRAERPRADARARSDPPPADASPATTAPSATTQTVVVRVYAKEGGTVAGAAVDLHRVVIGAKGYEAPIETSGTSGDDGVVRFTVRRARYFARASKAGRIGASGPRDVPLATETGESKFAVVLHPTVRHEGTVVVAETGDPIVGAVVRVNAGGLISETKTDAGGRFEFANIAFEQDPAAWVEAFGYMADSPPRKGPDATTVVWSFRLRQATVVRGLFRGLDGARPNLSGEFWLVVGDDAGTARLWIDGEGRFETSIAGPKGALHLRSEDYAPVRLGVEATGPGVIDLGEIRLVPGRTLRGRVLDVTGAPVANVRVGARSLDVGLDIASATTNAKGEFEIGGLGDGELEVSTTEYVEPPLAGSRPDTKRRGVFAGGGDLAIQQPEGNAVLLRLRDASNAELVVRSVRVHVRRAPDPNYWSRLFGQNVHTLRVLADKPGECDLRVEAEGYETAEVLRVTFPEGRAAPVDVRLTPKAK